MSSVLQRLFSTCGLRIQVQLWLDRAAEQQRVSPCFFGATQAKWARPVRSPETQNLILCWLKGSSLIDVANVVRFPNLYFGTVGEPDICRHAWQVANKISIVCVTFLQNVISYMLCFQSYCMLMKYLITALPLKSLWFAKVQNWMSDSAKTTFIFSSRFVNTYVLVIQLQQRKNDNKDKNNHFFDCLCIFFYYGT